MGCLLCVGLSKLITERMAVTDISVNIINTLIDKVIVYEKEIVDCKEIQKIKIFYKFVGDI